MATGGLKKYINKFEEEEVDYSDFVWLGTETETDLGLNIGSRIHIEDKIKKHQNQRTRKCIRIYSVGQILLWTRHIIVS